MTAEVQGRVPAGQTYAPSTTRIRLEFARQEPKDRVAY
jgi:hypothetical protein